jgi:hypothetical protein
VLSVYIDGTAKDLAAQRAWRVQVDRGILDLRLWLEGSLHREREAFERCVRLLERELEGFAVTVGAAGWAGFITTRGVHAVQQLPVPAPTLVVWSTGMCVAPYVRVLKEMRPVVVAVVDARGATIYSYQCGALDRLENLRAHHVVEPPLHMGNAPRQGFHSGTHGETGHDAAQRSRLEGRDRMLAEASARIMELAKADGWIVLGGIPRVVAHLARLLAPRARGRLREAAALDIHASDAEIAEAARAGASALRDAWDEARVTDIAGRAGSMRRGVLGPEATHRALEQASVRELYLTHRYLMDHMTDAEDAVRSALDQGAVIEEVSRSVAERLDEHGGIAALLRFAVPEIGAGRDQPPLQMANGR